MSLPLWQNELDDDAHAFYDLAKWREALLSVTRALAPRGADRFYHLVQVGFYEDGLEAK